tara:strand:+ start:763 stop:1647 length:885 start_codon:yes stop_codon:yes gene_type:complete
VTAWSTVATACERPRDYQSILTRPNQALLYKVEKCGVPVQYVFGTFHSDSPDLTPLAAMAGDYIRQSDQLNLEIVMTPLDQKRAHFFMLLPSGSPDLPDVIGTDMFMQVRKKLLPLIGLSPMAAKRYQPWAIAILAQYPKPEGDGMVLDSRLQAIAAQAQVPVDSLEDVDDQFEIFTEMNKQEAFYFLEHTLEQVDTLEADLVELKRLYLNRDLTGIYEMSRRVFGELAEKDAGLARYLEEELIDKRNIRMAQAMEEDFDKTTLTAVGALHLPGEKGILYLLEQDGYTITPLEN